MFTVARMSIFAGKCGLAIVLAVLCLGGRTADAQGAPVRYWIPGGPFGFGGGSTEGQGSDTYGNFPGFDIRAGGFSASRYNFPNGMFVGSERGGIGLNGIGQAGAFGNFGGLSYEGVQFGYNFKGAGDLPVTVFAGFDTLKYNPGAIGPLAPFNSSAGAAAGYSVKGGLEFKPTSNLSLSFGVGYTQQQSGRLDSDINSPLLPGESPFFVGGRR
jgi:opacity protein-like surface antigen